MSSLPPALIIQLKSNLPLFSEPFERFPRSLKVIFLILYISGLENVLNLLTSVYRFSWSKFEDSLFEKSFGASRNCCKFSFNSQSTLGTCITCRKGLIPHFLFYAKIIVICFDIYDRSYKLHIKLASCCKKKN